MLRTLGSLQTPLIALVERFAASSTAEAPKIILPKGFKPMPATPAEEVDRIISTLSSNAQKWVDTDPSSRAALLHQAIEATLAVAEPAATATVEHKGAYGKGIGDELVSWVVVVSAMREYADTLEHFAKHGTAPPPQHVYQRKDGQWVADVWPLGLDNLLYGGFKGEIWVQPDVKEKPTQARLYREKAAGTTSKGGVCLVLGAGNYLPVVCWDILHVLLTQDQVVICKMNPVNEYLGPFIRQAFQPFVDAGFLEFVYGGGDIGKQIVDDDRVVAVHLTGSTYTYQAIVWQGQPQVGEPPFKKPVHAELGCVTPVIIVPGPWTDAELEFHAESVATGVTNNAGHNCVHAEVLITDASWPLRDKFVAAVKRRLDASPRKVAYYPGSGRKFDAFQERFPQAEQLGVSSPEESTHECELKDPRRMEVRTYPWLFASGLTPEEAKVDEENFCGVLQEVGLPSTNNNNVADFLKEAVNFANDRCWGTLSCSIFIHPKTHSKYKTECDEAIAALKFGSVNVNVLSIVGCGMTRLSWGAYGAERSPDPNTGNCAIHNTLMIDELEKSVLWAPWRPHPFPFWNAAFANSEKTAKRALAYYAKPSVGAILPLSKEALSGIPKF